MKIPRKLKKELKKSLLKLIDPAWKSNEIRIDSVGKTSYPTQRSGVAKYKGTYVTSYRLI